MIKPEVLRKAQLIMLDMLVEFDELCKKHHLKYWLDSGTLLGAVRHQGFIPWDDDIDLSMPLEDYNKLLELGPKALSKNIFFQTSTTDPDFKFDYIKLRSNKASIVEFQEKNKGNNGTHFSLAKTSSTLFWLLQEQGIHKQKRKDKMEGEKNKK